MKTLFSILLLIIFGVITNFISLYALNLAGALGAFIAGSAGENYVNRKRIRYVFGVIISTLGQSFVYLAYTAFIISWSSLAISKQQVSFIIWPTAFLVTIIPIWMTSLKARQEGKEGGYINAQIEALPITLLIVLIGFFVFAFSPRLMEAIYGWLPYIGN